MNIHKRDNIKLDTVYKPIYHKFKSGINTNNHTEEIENKFSNKAHIIKPSYWTLSNPNVKRGAVPLNWSNEEFKVLNLGNPVTKDTAIPIKTEHKLKSIGGIEGSKLGNIVPINTQSFKPENELQLVNRRNEYIAYQNVPIEFDDNKKIGINSRQFLKKTN